MLSIKCENGLENILINSYKRVVSYCNKLTIYYMCKIKVRLIFTALFLLIVLPSVNFVELPQS